MHLNQSEIEALLKDVGAWLTGHFLLASGLHSNQYVQCQRIMQYPRHGIMLAEALSAMVLAKGLQPMTVVGPALGAIHWEVYVAHALDKAMAEDSVRGIFAERPDGKFEIRRGLELIPGEPVLIVEDVTTTGGSAKQVIELVRELGAEPVAVGTVIDRSGGTIDFGIPFFSLVKMDLASYQADSCPLCKDGIPLVKPGSSKLKVK
ncbi:MAG: orotate phosphoribosyltransferase [Candidatus Obscuribacterales bacterium]|nr:orotate phosphoribosyltransferase [Candidatus Obscuribacterales bacterium]